MKLSRYRTLAITAPVALALLVAVAAPAAPQERGAGYAVELEIVPHPEPPGAYRAEALVTDLETDEVLSRPTLVFLRGEGGGQIRTGTFDGVTLGIHVEVDESGESASYQAEIWRGEELVSAHRVRVRLAGEEPAE